MSMRPGFAAVLAPILVACGTSAAGAELAPSASSSASAPSATELSDYCGSVCKRATACGLDAADEIVRGDPKEVALLSRMKADAPKTEASCREACIATPPADADRAALTRAGSCVEQSSCDALEACLSSVAKGTPRP